jgi:sulfite reductase alpha subunit-like flavoprotein
MYLIHVRKSILDVLDEYSSVQASLELLIDVCTRLQPRFYSISSSSSRDPNSAHLTVGLVDEEIPNLKGKKYEGTASGAVARLQEGQKTFVFVSPVTIPFRLPKDPSTPIMMVCAGTGLAPFRGFLHERKFQIDSRRKSNPDYRGGNAFLVFGCRCAEHDYIYREELEALKQEGVLTDIVCAFSRSSTAPKSYVQHQIWEHRDLVWKHLSEEGLFFVCGSAKGMAKEVKETLVQVAAEVGKVSDATEYVQQLLSKHQYLEDVWG